MKGPFAISMLAVICFALVPGCSPTGEPAERNVGASPASPVPTKTAPTPSALIDRALNREDAVSTAENRAESQVLDKKQFTLRGEPACEVRFVYAGRETENLFWEEPCPAVTAKMLTQRELEAFGRWERLDSFARKFVHALPGGKVLYVEGSFSASVYPVGTTGATYEVPVAD